MGGGGEAQMGAGAGLRTHPAAGRVDVGDAAVGPVGAEPLEHVAHVARQHR